VSGSLFNSTGNGDEDKMDNSGDAFVSLPPQHHQQQHQQQQPHSLATYVGFSAQSFSIPSIACDSDVSHGSVIAEIVSRYFYFFILTIFTLMFFHRF
jgi:hypothetical protein